MVAELSEEVEHLVYGFQRSATAMKFPQTLLLNWTEKTTGSFRAERENNFA